ncbi:putative aminoglycoside 3-N-acetyltransferase [Actinoplanes missouriensis 431]|uniref:Aminoglycoside N(3)-acetyltransferase n=1 Tax=Actinoplanes missouriensis (strain ATCC 14538 / DSM 43046 / CBS 188.64 / JCM 3121 / NBRC 102363 / NCIMB 12654 / NRRL B-3342 / UNCC 431) TaxID=512565 RepID=I0H3J1_ACTM4|nr:AAC(3) family N-acetyltransferase [Actinoplanes missouriensis]BAL87578.1 putative aminoglycoside 3-N-acetyltransferase [Actinoplanes missouriensis 431]
MTGPVVTRAALVADLIALGVGKDTPAGGALLVHCSMRRIGWIEGGPATLLAALREVCGPGTTIVVPAQTPNNSLTSPVYRAATAGLSDADRDRYVAAMPGFDPDTTPSYGVGGFAEHVRAHPGALRSRHPQTSFAALGPAAAGIVAVHDLDCHLGERSPLGALYRGDTSILLLGVGVEKCTALHLAEYRAADRFPRPGAIMEYSCFVTENDRRELRRFAALKLDDGDFGTAGKDLLRHSWATTGQVGDATAHLFPLVPAVDAAQEWFSTHRH